MAVRFHSLRDSRACRPSLQPQESLPTIHASTGTFRSFLRLVDRDSAFFVRRWNNDLYLEEDLSLYSRAWLEDDAAPSAELLALLDAAEWAGAPLSPSASPSAPPTSASSSPGEEESYRRDIDSLLADDEAAVQVAVLSLTKATPPKVLPPKATPPGATPKVHLSKPTLKRSCSVDATSTALVPYRSSADARTLRAFMHCSPGRLSWRRNRQLFLCGFRLMLVHDLDVLVNETVRSTILFKPEVTLEGNDMIDLWLEGMLTGADQVALIRKDETATASRDPQIQFVSLELLRPDERTQKKTMINSYGLLTFLARNCDEGKSYRLFRDGNDNLVLVDESDNSTEPLANNYDVSRKVAIIESSVGQCSVQLVVARECLRLGARILQQGYPDTARRLLKNGLSVLTGLEDVSELALLLKEYYWLGTVQTHHERRPSGEELIEVLPIYLELRDALWRKDIDNATLNKWTLAEIEYIHLLYSALGESPKRERATRLEAAYAVVIGTFLRLHSIAMIQKRLESRRRCSTQLRLILSMEILTTYLRLSNVSETLLASLPESEAAVPVVRTNCQSWQKLRAVWAAHSQYENAENVFPVIDRLLSGEEISLFAIAAIHYISGYREKIARLVWDQWIVTGSRPSSAKVGRRRSLAQVAAVFRSADQLIADPTTLSWRRRQRSEALGSSMLLLARVYNDLAVLDLFSLDASRRRSTLPRTMARLMFALHLLCLHFLMMVVDIETQAPDTSAFKFTSEWICVVTINLIRAIQVSASSFKVTNAATIKAAMHNGDYQGAEFEETANCLFSIKQYECYRTAVALAHLLRAYAKTLDQHLDKPGETSYELPLQTGVSCDQLLPHLISVRPHFQLTTKQLAVISEERIPLMCMALAVDLNQYFPSQKVLIDSERQAASTRSLDKTALLPEDIELAKGVDLPKLRERVRNKVWPQNCIVSQECVRACLELCDFARNGFTAEAIAVQCPTDGDHKLCTPSSIVTPREVDIANFETWLAEHAPRAESSADMVKSLNLSTLPRSELHQWMPASVADCEHADLHTLALLACCAPQSTPVISYPSIPSSLLPDSRLNAISASKDVSTVIEKYLLYAAGSNVTDRRETAAAHYHLGVHLNNMNRHMTAAQLPQVTVLQDKLRERRKVQAVAHLHEALESFDPAQCIKDFVNVQAVLHGILDQEEQHLKAVALVLAADITGTRRKNEASALNEFDAARFIQTDSGEYIGIIALRGLAQTSLLKALKAGGVSPPLRANDWLTRSPSAAAVYDRLRAMSQAELKGIYRILLKRERLDQLFIDGGGAHSLVDLSRPENASSD